ncbi:MAG: 1-acyl-sn-glycerol-3-phosphate acyltransferase [Pseudomonadota bacterium]
MSDFERMRPYQDEEVPAVVARLVRNEALRRGVAALVFPRLARTLPSLAQALTGTLLRWRGRRIGSVLDFQMQMGRYIDLVLRTRITSLSYSGLERVPRDRACLFISNHRDIVYDSGIINRLLYEIGQPTCRLAIGDNLFTADYAADIMRLNKGFMIERTLVGRKAQYAAMQRTARYVRSSLEEGEHVWIAQRAGRAKDGLDRTEPALLKMLGLAFRKETEDFQEIAARLQIIPTAISYELDPTDLRKARELELLARNGTFEKSSDDDLAAIAEGLTGFKGRMHVHFGTLATADTSAPVSAEALAEAIDREIVGHLQLYPTHAHAAQQLDIPVPGPVAADDGRALPLLTQRLADCDAAQRPYLLAQYGNLARNKAQLDAVYDVPPAQVLTAAL